MNIFEFAKKMEKDGENYYRELAQQSPSQGFQAIMIMLADAEVKHYNILDEMEKKSTHPELTETTVLNDAKNLFVKMKEDNETFDFQANQVDLYRKAQQIEEQSEQFYLDKAHEVKDESQKTLFLKLAEEEKKHKFLMENIVDFVNRPQEWIENGEFNHLEDY